jgi:hypothetical protein
LEVYLNGGLIAVGFLMLLLLNAQFNLKRRIASGCQFAIFQFLLLVIGIVHNFTEASISKGGSLIWFALLLAMSRTRQMLKDSEAE